MSEKTILFIGNYFLSKNSNRNVWFEIPSKLEKLGWKTLTTSNKKLKPLRLLGMLYTIFANRRAYDLAMVDVFSGSAFIWAEMSAWLLNKINKPFLLNLRGGNLPEFANHYPHRVIHTLKSANVVTSPSAYLKESLQKFRKDIQIIPNPIEIASYSYRPRKLHKPKLMWVRAFHEIYNPSLAPKVLDKLTKKWPNIHLSMVGPDKGDGSLQKFRNLSETLNMENHISLIGGVPRYQVPTILNQGDIFINTTNFDNTPVSVIEAMACGLCIVSTNVGGIPYLLADEINALLVPPDDPQAMAEAIERIILNPDLAARLSLNARQKAERFDWSIVLPKWDHLFNEILDSSCNNEIHP